MRYESEALGQAHDLSAFRCGNAALDRWLIEAAHQAAANRTARTFVWLDRNRVVGYYSLAAHHIEREMLTHRIGRGSPDTIPAVLLGKLALDTDLHGQHLGEGLLVDALERVLKATEQVAARSVVVDAIDEQAVSFYEKFGFLRTGSTSSRLVRKLSDIAKAFGRPNIS